MKPTHPSIPPTEAGVYTLIGWYGDTMEARFVPNERYGRWHSLKTDAMIDSVAIMAWYEFTIERL